MDKIAPPISHKTVLKYTGVIGFVLPIVLIVGLVITSDCDDVLPSLSAYKHTIFGDYFVASLAAIAFCLYAYRGYSGTDNLLSNIASIALLGVAFLPTWIHYPTFDARHCLNGRNADNEIIGNFHYVCAAVFFFILAFFCLVQFPKGRKPFTKNKKRVNIVFYSCGIMIILSIIGIILYSTYLKKVYPNLKTIDFILWAEIVALYAFSIAWFVKGKITFEKNGEE